MDNEKPVDISYKKLKPEAKTPKVRNNGNMFGLCNPQNSAIYHHRHR